MEARNSDPAPTWGQWIASCTRWLVFWTLLACTAILAGRSWVLMRLDEQVRRKVEELLAERLPELKVHVARAHFEMGLGVELHGIRIRKSESLSAKIGTLEFRSRAGLVDLLQGNFPSDQVIARRCQLRLPSDQSEWSWLEHLPPAEGPLQLPPITILESSVHLTLRV